MECRCRGAGYYTLQGPEWALARLCECRSPCPTCQGRGFIVEVNKDRQLVSRPCECRDLEKRVRLFNNAHIPARMYSRTLENYEERGGNQASVKMKVMRFRDEYANGAKGGLLLWGAPGRGKTHLACALIRHFTLEYGISARFVDFFQLVEEIKSGFDEGRSLDDFLSSLMEPEVLVVDELGKRRPSEFELSVLDQLICRRYNTNRPLIATTNFDVSDGPSKAGGLPRLVDQGIGDRIYSRLRSMCAFIEVTGEDYRKRLPIGA